MRLVGRNSEGNGNFSHKFHRRAAILATAAGILFGSVNAFADSRPTPIRLTLDRPLDGASAPFAVAAARGLFRAENVAVTLDAAT